MKTAQQWLDEYGVSHQNPTNKAIHWVCIPLIVVSLIGLLWPLQSPVLGLSWATVVLAGAIAYYATLSLSLALGMAICSLGIVAAVMFLDGLSSVIPLWVSSLVIFVGAWIGQFIGHKIEGKKPSFFQDLQFLLIGPLWLLGHTYRKFGIRF